MTNPYENLANEIIRYAAEEYRDKLMVFKGFRDRGSGKMYERKLDLLAARKFFTSEWYQVLTSLDGNALAEKLEQEVFGDDYKEILRSNPRDETKSKRF